MRKTVLLLFAVCCGCTAFGQVRVRTGGSVSYDGTGFPHVSTSATVRSQGQRDNRWVFTGGLGLGFGNSYTRVNVSPQIGYALTDWFVAGAGVTYDYYDQSHNSYASNSLGLNVYGRCYIARYITLHVQPEVARTWWRYRGASSGDVVSTSILAGGGLTLPVSYNSYLSVLLLYDILQSDDSPYGDRIVYSVGYGFRF